MWWFDICKYCEKMELFRFTYGFTDYIVDLWTRWISMAQDTYMKIFFFNNKYCSSTWSTLCRTDKCWTSDVKELVIGRENCKQYMDFRFWRGLALLTPCCSRVSCTLVLPRGIRPSSTSLIDKISVEQKWTWVQQDD